MKNNAQWRVFYLGAEGKKRNADDITIPSHLGEDELHDYIAGLCHEWSGAGNDRVIKLK